GIWAPLLLVLLRLLQGLSVGGEYTTSSIFLVEASASGHRGFLGSFVPFGSCGGVLFGSGIGAAVTNLLDHASVVTRGWRVPFLFCIPLGRVPCFLPPPLYPTSLSPCPLPPPPIP